MKTKIFWGLEKNQIGKMTKIEHFVYMPDSEKFLVEVYYENREILGLGKFLKMELVKSMILYIV